MPVLDLTPMQARFVAEWQKDQNGTQAAIRAGANPNSAHVTASKWLKLPKVVAMLETVHATAVQRVAESTEEAVGSAEWIIREAAETYEEAREGRQYGPAITALALLAKRHPEFRDATINVDARTLNVTTRGKLSG